MAMTPVIDDGMKMLPEYIPAVVEDVTDLEDERKALIEYAEAVCKSEVNCINFTPGCEPTVFDFKLRLWGFVAGWRSAKTGIIRLK
jgi:hypothetical protein